MGLKPEITISQAKKIIKSAIVADLNGYMKYRPILLEGASGIGKTETIFQIGQELTEMTGKKFDVYDFRAGQKSIQDLGIPFPHKIGNTPVVRFLQIEKFPGVVPGALSEYGIFFLDELTTITEEPIIAGLLQLLTDRKIADYELPRNWYIVAAGNRKEDGNVYRPIPFPVRNRMEIYTLKFNKNEWMKYLKRMEVKEEIINFLNACKEEKDFLTYNPELEVEGSDVDPENYVCATPRSWVALNDRIKALEITGFNSTIKTQEDKNKELEELKVNTKNQLGEIIKSISELAPHIATICNKLGVKFSMEGSKIEMGPISQEQTDSLEYQDKKILNEFNSSRNLLQTITEEFNYKVEEIQQGKVKLTGQQEDMALLESVVKGVIGSDVGHQFILEYRKESTVNKMIKHAEKKYEILKEHKINVGTYKSPTEEDMSDLEEMIEEMVSTNNPRLIESVLKVITMYEMTDEMYASAILALKKKEVSEVFKEMMLGNSDESKRLMQWYKYNSTLLSNSSELEQELLNDENAFAEVVQWN